jgi:hypothetical protein
MYKFCVAKTRTSLPSDAFALPFNRPSMRTHKSTAGRAEQCDCHSICSQCCTLHHNKSTAPGYHSDKRMTVRRNIFGTVRALIPVPCENRRQGWPDCYGMGCYVGSEPRPFSKPAASLSRKVPARVPAREPSGFHYVHLFFNTIWTLFYNIEIQMCARCEMVISRGILRMWRIRGENNVSISDSTDSLNLLIDWFVVASRRTGSRSQRLIEDVSCRRLRGTHTHQ